MGGEKGGDKRNKVVWIVYMTRGGGPKIRKFCERHIWKPLSSLSLANKVQQTFPLFYWLQKNKVSNQEMTSFNLSIDLPCERVALACPLSLRLGGYENDKSFSVPLWCLLNNNVLSFMFPSKVSATAALTLFTRLRSDEGYKRMSQLQQRGKNKKSPGTTHNLFHVNSCHTNFGG